MINKQRHLYFFLGVVLVYAVVAAGVFLGFWGQEWRSTAAPAFASPDWQHPFGTNAIGQDVFARMLQSVASAFQLGILATGAALMLAAALGILCGWRSGNLLDRITMYMAGVFDAIPFYLLIAILALFAKGNIWWLATALTIGLWTSPFRLIRAETMRLASADYLQAAVTSGIGSAGLILRHLSPNLRPILILQCSLLFVTIVKVEVLLTLMGLGLPDRVSWGSMIIESIPEVLGGHFATLVSASLAMFFLLWSVNMLSDTISDQFDLRVAA